MIVDDEPANLTILAEILGCEYNIRVATNGEKALKIAFSAEQPDLVLLDIKMPGMDGYEVCRKMKSDVQTKNIPIIFLTGKSSEQDEVKGFAAGAVDYVTKPFSAALIKARVKTHIQLMNSEKEQRKTLETLKSLIDAIPDLMFEVGADGYYYRCHSPNSGLLYAPIQELLGRKIPEVLPPAASAVVMSAIDEAGQKGISLGKCYQLDVPEGKCWFEISAASIDNSVTDGRFILVVRDITERKRLEKEIQRSAEIQQVLREIAEAAILCDSLNELYRTVYLLMDKLMPQKNFLINIIDEKTRQIARLRLVDGIGIMQKNRPMGRHVTEYVIRKGQTQLVNAAEYERLLAIGEVDSRYFEFKEWLGAPLKDATGKTFGVVRLMVFEEGSSFQPEEVEFLTTVAAQIAMAIDRKRAATQLADSEVRLQTLVDTIPDMIWLKDPEGIYLSCNPRFEEFFGAKEADILGKTDYDFVDRSLAEFFRENDRKAIATGKPRINEEEITFAADGRKVLMETVKAPMFNSERTLIGVLGIARDITARKKAAEAQQLRAKVQQVLREIVEISVQASSMDELYREVHRLVNRVLPARNFFISLSEDGTGNLERPFSAGEMTGVPKQRGPAKGLTEHVMRQGRAMHVSGEEFDRLYAAGEIDRKTFPDNNWLIAPLVDSQAKSFGVIAINLPDDAQPEQTGNVDILSIIARQVALAIERKRRETELRISEERFRELTQKIPIPLSIVDQSGTFTFINERFVQSFGYIIDEIPTKEEWRARAFPDAEYRQWVDKTWRAALEDATSRRGDIDPQEYNITCKDGAVRSVITNGILLGKEVLVTFLDMTERKRHERALKISYERRRKCELMNGLVQGGATSPQVVLESARTLGAKMMVPFTCFLIVIEEYKAKPRDYWLENLDEYQLLQDSMLDALEQDQLISWEAQDGIGVLSFDALPAKITKDSQKKTAEALRTAIVRKLPELILSIGISDTATNMVALGTHYRQAKIAVNAGQKLWPQSKNYHYLEMGVFQLLSRFTDKEEIAQYIQRTLGKILVLEKKKREAYLDTLEIILMSDNQKDGALKLGIHYKTLMFRKQRIEKTLEVSFDDFSARMAILTALHLLKLHKQ